MPFDYFYGKQGEQHAFYRIPKLLFTDSRFQTLSTDAKLLYGMLIDRMELSLKNGWIDEQGRIYLYFTIGEIFIGKDAVNFHASYMLPALFTMNNGFIADLLDKLIPHIRQGRIPVHGVVCLHLLHAVLHHLKLILA